MAGEHIGSHVPYGYCKNPDNPKEWLVDDEAADKHNFVCSTYRSRTTACSMHYIRNVVIEQIVLDNLKEVIGYVSNYENEFVQMVMDTDVCQRNKELAKQKKRLLEIRTRMKELDNFFRRIYEDNISGKLSDERFMKLSKGYDTEQADLQEELAQLQTNIEQEEKQTVNEQRTPFTGN